MTAASRTATATRQSGDWLRWLGIILAVLGLAVAAYMGYAELTGQETTCPGATEGTGTAGEIAVDCGFVQNSIYSHFLGIPVALLGIAGYLAILAAWLLEDRVNLLKEYGPILVFGMALFGLLFSAYLTYTELAIMYTVCTWCLTSALLMTLVFVIATIRLVAHFRGQTA